MKNYTIPFLLVFLSILYEGKSQSFSPIGVPSVPETIFDILQGNDTLYSLSPSGIYQKTKNSNVWETVYNAGTFSGFGLRPVMREDKDFLYVSHRDSTDFIISKINKKNQTREKLYITDQGDTLTFISDLEIYNGVLFLNLLNKIYRSTDQGVTWENCFEDANLNIRFNDGFFDNSLREFQGSLFLGGSKDVWKSEDIGATWQKVHSSEEQIEFFGGGNSALFLSPNLTSYYFRSTDGFETIDTLTKSDDNPLTIFRWFEARDTLFHQIKGLNPKFLYSIDTGTTWTDYFEEEEICLQTTERIIPLTENFIAYNINENHLISKNGWGEIITEDITRKVHIHQLEIIQDELWIACTSGVYRKATKTASWEKIILPGEKCHNPFIYRYIIYQHDHLIFIKDRTNKVYYREDNGNQWFHFEAQYSNGNQIQHSFIGNTEHYIWSSHSDGLSSYNIENGNWEHRSPIQMSTTFPYYLVSYKKEIFVWVGTSLLSSGDEGDSWYEIDHLCNNSQPYLIGIIDGFAIWTCLGTNHFFRSKGKKTYPFFPQKTNGVPLKTVYLLDFHEAGNFLWKFESEEKSLYYSDNALGRFDLFSAFPDSEVIDVSIDKEVLYVTTPNEIYSIEPFLLKKETISNAKYTVKQNPVRSQLNLPGNILFPNLIKANIYSIDGRLYKSENLPPSKEWIIDVDILNNGIYFLQLKSDTFKQTLKFVKI